MFCTNCGKKIPTGAEFCTGCGKKVSGTAGKPAQEKNKPRYFWLFLALKWIGYPILFFFVFMALAIDLYYFQTSQTIIAISILAGSLLVIVMVILQSYVKLFRYSVTGLLMLSVLAGLALLGIGVYRHVIQKPLATSVTEPSSLPVTVVEGPVSGASVNIYELDANGGKGNSIAGPLISDALGNVNFDLPADLPERLLIEARGGLYTNEATGQQVQLKDTDVLTAVLPAGTKSAAVTPFTHMAAALAKAKIQGGVVPDEAVILANEAVAKQYGLQSILDLPSENKQYGLALAGLAQLAKNLSVPPTDLVEALAKDWSDGTVDGKQNGQAITVTSGAALGTAGTAGLTKATDQFVKTEKNPNPKESSVIVNPPPVKKIAFRITATSLPAWVSGQAGSYTIMAEGGSSPLSWSVKSGSLPQGFSLSKDGILSGSYILPTGVTKKIFAPFTVEVKDQKGQTQSVELSITVAPEAPQITTYNPPTLIVGKSYDEIIAKASGGTPPYGFYREASSGPMPFGMTPTTQGSEAHLTGSPKARGNFSFRVCVLDGANVSKCGNVAFAVEEGKTATPAAESQDTEGCPTPWDGTWSGTFQQAGDRWYIEDKDNQLITHPYSFSFNVEFTAKCEWYHRDEDWASLKITHAVISHPFFGCQGGCDALGTFSTETGGKETFVSLQFPNKTHFEIQNLQLTGNSITMEGHQPDVYFGDEIRLEDAFYDVEGVRESWPACQLSVDCYPSSVGADYNITFTKQ